jgi:putative cardiolipin synthase
LRLYGAVPAGRGVCNGAGRDTKGKWDHHQAGLSPAKTFVLDRKQMFIGSLNLDPRSAVHNTEIGLVLSSADLAREFGDWFDQNVEKLAFRLELKTSNSQKKILWHGLVDGQPTTLTDEPHAGFWLKFKVGLFGMLPVESQL